jgi:hypothetical protein
MTSLNFLMLLDINTYTYNTYVYVSERQMISNQRPWRYRKKELQGNNFFKFFFSETELRRCVLTDYIYL